MGWNTVEAPAGSAPVRRTRAATRFYFVHSYAAQQWTLHVDRPFGGRAACDLGRARRTVSSPPSRTGRCRPRSSIPEKSGDAGAAPARQLGAHPPDGWPVRRHARESRAAARRRRRRRRGRAPRAGRRRESRRATATRATPRWPGSRTVREWIHLVDLDAAFGRGSNRELLAEVVGDSTSAVETVRRHPRRRLPERGPRHRLRAGQPRHRRARGPRLVRPGDRRARRPDCRRARRHAARRSRPRLDAGRRRPLGGPRTARRRRLRPLRRHRRHQGRHAHRPEPRPAARGLRSHRRARSSPPAASSTLDDLRASRAWSPTAWRARSSERRCTPGVHAGGGAGRHCPPAGLPVNVR